MSESGETNVAFVMGKLLDVPTNTLTMPKLELTSVVLLTKVIALLRNELEQVVFLCFFMGREHDCYWIPA